MPDSLPTGPRRRLALACWCLLAASGPAALYFEFDWVMTTRLNGARLLYDQFDISVYFYTSRWVTGDGVLYRDVPSEYPLAANLLFGAVRVGAEEFRPFPVPLHSFAWAWMSTAWVVLVWLFARVAADLHWPALLLFAHPVVIFFTLVRFDIYPVALTYLALRCAARDRYLGAAGWLGLAVAVKGYPLFVVPPLVVFVWRRAGARRAALALVVALAPIAAATAAVYLYAGADGVAGPYRFHARRGLDSGSSTYDVADQVFGWTEARRIVEWPRLPNVGVVVATLLATGLAALRRPEHQFRGLLAAGLLGPIALMSFSTFYSPQFVLWLLPFVAWSGSRGLRVVTHVYLVATWLYFPYAFDRVVISGYAKQWTDLMIASVTVLTVCRFLIAAVAAVWLCRGQDSGVGIQDSGRRQQEAGVGKQ